MLRLWPVNTACKTSKAKLPLPTVALSDKIIGDSPAALPAAGFVKNSAKNPSEVVTTLGETGTMSSRRTVRALQNSSDLRANRMRRRGNRERLNPRPMPRPSDKMDDDDSRY